MRSLLIASVVAIALAGCSVAIEERYLLFPWSQKLPPLADDVVRRNVEVPVGGGVVLRGWLLDVPDERFTLVFYYGNGQSVVGEVTELYMLADILRADVVCVDYRGYGFSDGKPTLAQLDDDALRVFDHAARQARGRPMLVMGYSLGAGVAAVVAARREAAGAILVAPPASPDAIVDHIESRLPWYARLFFDLEPAPSLRALDPTPERAIRDVTEPLLVVHGTADPDVPFHHGRRLFERAGSRRKQHCAVEGEDHAMALFAVDRYRTCVTEFVESIAHDAAR